MGGCKQEKQKVWVLVLGSVLMCQNDYQKRVFSLSKETVRKAAKVIDANCPPIAGSGKQTPIYSEEKPGMDINRASGQNSLQILGRTGRWTLSLGAM